MNAKVQWCIDNWVMLAAAGAALYALADAVIRLVVPAEKMAAWEAGESKFKKFVGAAYRVAQALVVKNR